MNAGSSATDEVTTETASVATVTTVATATTTAAAAATTTAAVPVTSSSNDPNESYIHGILNKVRRSTSSSSSARSKLSLRDVRKRRKEKKNLKKKKSNERNNERSSNRSSVDNKSRNSGVCASSHRQRQSNATQPQHGTSSTVVLSDSRGQQERQQKPIHVDELNDRPDNDSKQEEKEDIQKAPAQEPSQEAVQAPSQKPAQEVPIIAEDEVTKCQSDDEKQLVSKDEKTTVEKCNKIAEQNKDIEIPLLDISNSKADESDESNNSAVHHVTTCIHDKKRVHDKCAEPAPSDEDSDIILLSTERKQKRKNARNCSDSIKLQTSSSKNAAAINSAVSKRPKLHLSVNHEEKNILETKEKVDGISAKVPTSAYNIEDTHDKYQHHSPDLDDFDYSKEQQLANKEKEYKQKHDDLLERSKYKDVVSNKRTTNKRKKPSTSTRTKGKSKAKDGEKCVLCSTCSCTRPKGNDVLKSIEETALFEDKNPLSRQAKSDAEIERALINRLGRLEKSASYFDHLCIKVSKELKKHRKKIIKQREEKSKRAKITRNGELDKDSRFLDDMGDDLFQDKSLFPSTKFPSDIVQRARSQVHTYAFRRKCQPTLTQMLGDDDSNENEEDSNEYIIKNDSDDLADLNNATSESECHRNNERDDEMKEMAVLEEKNHDQLVSGTFVDYEVASSRGKARGLWGLSSVTETEMKETKQPDFEECISFDEDDYNMQQSTDSLCDRILSMKEHDGLEILVNLFGDLNDGDSKEADQSAPESLTTESDPTNILLLSPRCKELCSSIKSSVVKNAEKMETIEQACPNWEENIIFAFQQSPNELRDALCNVREKRSKIKKATELLGIMQRKDVVLELFESVITKSLARHSDEPLEGNRCESNAAL